MYNKYNSSDKRIRQWLVGVQRDAQGTRRIDDNYNPGDTIFINQAARTRPLIYNLNVISFNRNDYANTDSFEMAGARNVKYYPEPGS
jgi:hypothetical protein